ncbi:MAG: CHAP domain-containing protein [Agathobacter sp.]|nr:CHAP domain-containing protein [Agathobacter sp.]
MEVLKKEENPWKKNKGVKKGVDQGVNLVRNASTGIKRSLRASNIGEAEQEEQEAKNSSQGGSVSFSSLEKTFSNEKGSTNHPINVQSSMRANHSVNVQSPVSTNHPVNVQSPVSANHLVSMQHPVHKQPTEMQSRRSVKRTQNLQKDPVASTQMNVQNSQTEWRYQNGYSQQPDVLFPESPDYVKSPPEIFSNHSETVQGRSHQYWCSGVRKRKASVSKNGSQSGNRNPYGWGSSTGKNKWSSWESAKVGASPEMTGTSNFIGGQAMGGTTSQAAGSSVATVGGTVTGATGSAASGAATGAASGAAGGVVGVAVSGTVSVLQKGKEYIEEALQRSRQVRQEQKNQSGNGNSGTMTTFFGMAVMSIIIISVLVCSIAAMFYSISTRGRSIVEVAQAELEVWEDNIGGEKYKDWYGIDGNWCAMFVSWCSDQCGYIDDEIMPKTASVRTMSDWYKERNQYQSKGSGYEPKAGDIIFFQEYGSHTGIVIDYDSETKTVTTIEGNTGSSSTDPYHEGSRVKQKNYPLTHYKISGYGLPDYPFEETQTSTERTEEVALLPKKYAA